MPDLLAPCLEWTGALFSNGYGAKKVAGKNWRVHRWAWTEEHGPIPDGMVVMHLCDNKKCYEISHLRLGTQHDNVLDAHQKNRAAKDNAGTFQRAKTHCVKGHSLEDAYVRVCPNGWKRRACRACSNERNAISNPKRDQRKVKA